MVKYADLLCDHIYYIHIKKTKNKKGSELPPHGHRENPTSLVQVLTLVCGLNHPNKNNIKSNTQFGSHFRQENKVNKRRRMKSYDLFVKPLLP